MSNTKIWEKYEKIDKIGFGTYGNVYKVKNKDTEDYYAMKEIKKEKFEILENILSEEMNKIKSGNNISIKDIINNKDDLYIIKDLCEYNLEEYIKKRNQPLSINEIKLVLTQLNNIFKNMPNEEIIYRDLKLKNILIFFDRLDKCLIKLSYSYKFIKQSNVNSIFLNENLFTIAPEILNNEENNLKSNIWSLGIIIYYMLFKEYPYNGESEYQILKNIESNKQLKYCDNEKLNDLLNKMLKINIDERISWDDYFNHPFFNDKFEFNCYQHLKIINNYCKECKKNICDSCLNEHLNHQIIPFYKIGLSENEINRMENIFKDIDNKLNSFIKIKKEIEDLLIKMKLIKENQLIYENDMDNNYKEYYIKYLEKINKILENNEIKLIDLTPPKNEIICIYDIKKGNDDNYDYLNNQIRILNCLDEAKNSSIFWGFGKKNIEKEIEIEKNCELFINENKIDFCYKYKFPHEGKYSIKIICKKPLSNINYMFMDCNKLLSIDLSHFNNINVTNMSWMFNNCFSLTSLTLFNFNTINVKDMSCMFHYCSSLISLNLSSFNTINVLNMSWMFNNCISLKSLNLSSFKTNNVTNMSYMFSNCSSLTSLNLSSFNTNNVINMSYMFCDCISLIFLDLSNFNTNNVTSMRNMFNNCSSLTSLNLYNFNINNVKDMRNMFSGLKNDCQIISTDKNIKKI